MTKNRFLSKRLACLLTTALVSMPITLNKSFAQLAVTASANAVLGNTTVTFNGAADHILTVIPVSAGLTFTGAVTTTTTSGNGSILVTGIADAAPGVATFSGAVGTNALKLGSITVGTTALGGSAIFSSNVFAETTIGIVAGNAAAEVGTATFGGTTTALTSVTVGASATGTFNGITTTPSLVVTGTANIGAIDQAVAKVTLNSTGVIQLGKTLTATAAADSIFSNTAQLGGTLNATGKILLPSRLKGADTLNLFDDSTNAGTAATLLAATDVVVQDNALVDHTASIYSATGKTAATGIVITATNKTAAVTASELGVNVNKATAFLQARDAAIAADIATTDTASLSSIYNVLYALSGQSATADTDFTNQVSPQTDTITGSAVAAKAVTSGVQNVISTRLASLRSGDAYSTGVVTGSGMSANSGFIQAFGSKVEQKNKGNEFGYDADTTGFAVGFDGKIDGGAVIGISYARSEADVDGKGTGRAKNDIKTDSVSLYADYATKDGYVEGSITYGKSDNNGSRVINTGGLTNTYTSNSDSEQYSFRLSGGIPQSLGGGAFFTPFAAATISQIKADAYTESSTTANDALRLRVAQDTVDSQVGTIGVKYHQVIKDGKTTFTPEVKLAVNQEFGDGNITTTNTYQGGGASFKNSTAIERTSATAGVGLNISSDNVSFNIGYEADVKEKYLGHSAQAKITAKF
jgi:outer membrane autotransporter protein